ncbi:MAG: hypothetical protein O9283_11010 [Sphingomonadaceae bacterium]|nr:hypothetical protein [Sphingomonadaceae bacterium]
MLEKADEVLKLALAAAALLIGASVAYYYAIFLPVQAHAQAQSEAEAERAKREANEKAEARKLDAVRSAKSAYDQCLANSQSSYSDRWNASCKRLNKADLERQAECQANGFGYCDSIKITPAIDCALPTVVANDYDNRREEANKLCLEEFKASS